MGYISDLLIDWLGTTSAIQILIVVSTPFSEAVVANIFAPFALQYACKSH